VEPFIGLQSKGRLLDYAKLECFELKYDRRKIYNTEFLYKNLLKYVFTKVLKILRHNFFRNCFLDFLMKYSRQLMLIVFREFLKS